MLKTHTFSIALFLTIVKVLPLTKKKKKRGGQEENLAEALLFWVRRLGGDCIL